MIELKFRKLFVGGIDQCLSEQDLEAYFSQFGPLTSCTIHRNRETGRSRGFGFVTFKDQASVEAAQKKRPHCVQGCEVTTKRAVPRELFQAFDGILTVTKAFVGGLTQDIREHELHEYFSTFGNVRRVDVMVDRNTSASRGFGFVEFDDYDPVDKAVLQSAHVIKGKDVTVRKAKSRLEMELIRNQTLPPRHLGRPTQIRRRSLEEPSIIYDRYDPPTRGFACSSLDSFDFNSAYNPAFPSFNHAYPFGQGRGRFLW
ncbi:hypothetical protein JTE90_009043 [Oedothorax gibbosus]|uniref:RRM domain-containing protein n=1 Tax=Oedothorax gibbosus TaxID=931172 RepID=A0AAV6VHZ3_9ARAC|nr:hypothetical protein JTE90_009043 [Oedothorax gibbosus]